MPESLRAASVAELAKAAHAVALMHATPDAVVAIDPHGHITDWNPAAERMLGWSATEAIGQVLGELIVPPEHREGHRQGMARYLATGVAHILNRTIEVPCLHRDGHRLPVELSVFPVGPDGSLGFGAFMRDISERHKQAEALRQSEERNRAVVEHLGEGMVVIQRGKVVFANPQASRALGRPMEQLVGAALPDFVHPDDVDQVNERQRRRMAGEAVPSHYELRVRLPNGEVRWLENHVSSLQWDGAPAAMSFFADVTERHRQAQALRHSEERNRAIVENLGEGMLVIQERRVVFANAQAGRVLKRSMDEMLGATAASAT
jgi:PAS domain S-box-containing protein